VPWVKAALRGQSVFARADEAGRFALEGGRVEVRYKPNDGRRYDANPANLKVQPGAVMPDDTCGPAEGVKSERKGGAGAKGASKGKSKGASKAKTAAPIPVVDADTLVAYTDGACSGNPGPAGLGVVVLDQGRTVEIGEYLGAATNNVAELTAILRALEETADPGRPIVIHTDSKYSIGVLTKGWKAKANVELIGEIRSALTARANASFVYVPGHAGVPLNERADELARAAVVSRGDSRTERAEASRGDVS